MDRRPVGEPQPGGAVEQPASSIAVTKFAERPQVVLAVIARPALRHTREDHAVPDGQPVNTRSDLGDHAGPFVTEHDR
jgi:hypothetical protein